MPVQRLGIVEGLKGVSDTQSLGRWGCAGLVRVLVVVLLSWLRKLPHIPAILLLLMTVVPSE